MSRLEIHITAHSSLLLILDKSHIKSKIGTRTQAEESMIFPNAAIIFTSM